MATSIKRSKKELRQHIKSITGKLSKDYVTEQTDRIVATLFSLPQYQSAKRISVYMSMGSGEVVTIKIVHNAFKRGKKVFIPYIYKVPSVQESEPASLMDMLELQSEADYDSLQPDKWGIPTPSQESVAGRANAFGGRGLSEARTEQEGEGDSDSGLDLIVMPGVAFDEHLGRLGHGKGYYDYFLERYKRQAKLRSGRVPFLVAIALKEQLLPQGEKVPTDEWDWPLDALITGDGNIMRSGHALKTMEAELTT